MIFRRLTLQNFRQFSGEQTIEFSTDDRQNVTVVHGYNGSGKTTLLNAFVWLFYADFTPDFDAPELLANEATWSQLSPGETMEVVVNARFDHQDTTYVAKRRRVVKKEQDGSRTVKKEGELNLRYFDVDGKIQTTKGPENRIRHLLPESLYPFFFFNGERIEQLASPDAYDQVETGIKVLLDIEILERAIRHLNGKPARELRDEIAEHSGHRGKEVRKERDDLEEKKNAKLEYREELESNRNALENELEALNAKLREQPEIAKLQERRQNTEEKIETTKAEIKAVRKEIGKALSDDGYLAMAGEVLDCAKDILDDAYERGELPPAVKRQFVEDLLEKGECLCGRPVKPGSEHREELEKWRDRAGSGRVARIAQSTRSDIRNLRKRGDEFVDELKTLQERRGKLNQDRSELEELLDELDSEIGDRAIGEDFQELEARRNRVSDKLEQTGLDIAEVDRDIEELDEEIKEKDQEIQTIKEADKRGRLAQRRLKAAQKVAEALEDVRDIRKHDLREDISEILAEVWNDVSIKSYKAALDREYRLRLTKKVGGREEQVRGASTGEKQVLSLAFVSALVKKAQEIAESEGSAGLFTGGLYPLVMDSPFGSLEVDYRREVANWVPKLAPQIIIVVSETQWRNEVEEEVLPRIGREWILECHTPKLAGKDIELHGREYPYVVQSDEHERTKFSEVEL